MEQKTSNLKDIKNSSYYIIIYFFKDADLKDTYFRVMYSKWLNQKERKDAFNYWRHRIHTYYRLNSAFGINTGEIYNNKDADTEKKPIVRIHGDGREEWFSQSVKTPLSI